MKRQTATPAEPVTITAQRLVLTAPDGTPRMELAIGEHTLPSLRMFDPKGVCRVELSLLSCEDGGTPWPHVAFRDFNGDAVLRLEAEDNGFDGVLKMAGIEVWSLMLDARQGGAAAAERRRRRDGER